MQQQLLIHFNYLQRLANKNILAPVSYHASLGGLKSSAIK